MCTDLSGEDTEDNLRALKQQSEEAYLEELWRSENLEDELFFQLNSTMKNGNTSLATSRMWINRELSVIQEVRWVTSIYRGTRCN